MNFEGSKCKLKIDSGVDINRNFDIMFRTLGVNDPCHEEYAGASPFSEKESQALRFVIENFNITLAIDIHNYGNSWIYPFSYDKSGSQLQKNKTQADFYRYIKDKFSLKMPEVHVSTCYESLKYITDGVYIDWVLSKNVFSFAYEVGKSFFEDVTSLKISI